MVQETARTYKQSIAPLQRKDLKDYFLRANAHYPGYIRQEVFRVKLREVVQTAQHEMQLRKMQSEKLLYPDSRESLKSLIIVCVNLQDWRPTNLMADFSKQMQDQAKASLIAATVKPAAQLAAGKLIEKGVGKMANKVDTWVKNEKLNAKVGKGLSMAVHTYEPFKKTAGKTGEKHVNWLSINISETGFGMMVGRGIQTVGDKLSPNTETVEVSLNTEETRGLLMKTGMSEGWANGTMEVVDFVSDWVPVVAVTKMAEGVVINGIMSWKYWRMAVDAEKNQKYFDEKWNDITRKLKSDITADIQSLNDKELSDLCKLLEIDKQ